MPARPANPSASGRLSDEEPGLVIERTEKRGGNTGQDADNGEGDAEAGEEGKFALEFLRSI
jgi:hypothetical protein